ncbi:3'(2'),5'-bisphosphate nucleotidase [Ectothiorhodospiraceae bacterium BW-2]|nr:3'(2'),5'-bisphosphate nucleotidase [Ectothiorhodospiraceae bacterium BW-2]
MIKLADISRLTAAVIEIAHEAGRTLLELYATELKVEQKADMTPVTAADLAAHRLIQQRLQQLTPAIPVLSEESATIPFSERQQWRCYWLVDPLDGTREFIDHTGEFTVNIALICDQMPKLGVIYAPVVESYYYACEGEGAWKREATRPPKTIRVRQWQGGRVVLACGRSRYSAALKRLLQRLPEYEILTLGSALKSCAVAEGVADIYARFGPTSEWDTAAAQIILREAGGHLTDTTLTPLRYNCREELLNPHFIAFGGGEALRHYLLPSP